MTRLGWTPLVVDLLRRGCAVRFRAPGRSMEPTIPDGAEILVEPAPPDAPVQIGDVVLACVGERLIAHRVIAVESERSGAEARFWLRGDAQASVADCVMRPAILGKVKLVPAARPAGRNGVRRRLRLSEKAAKLFQRLYPSAWKVKLGRRVCGRPGMEHGGEPAFIPVASGWSSFSAQRR